MRERGRPREGVPDQLSKADDGEEEMIEWSNQLSSSSVMLTSLIISQSSSSSAVAFASGFFSSPLSVGVWLDANRLT